MSTLVFERPSVKTRTLTAIFAVVAAVALPQVFHFAGAVSGLGSAPGVAFLPMHLPVFLAGLLAGPVAGVLVGLASPLLSFALSGMPAAAMLPLMLVELAGYGLVSGLLMKAKMPVLCKVLIAQAAGRILRAAAILIAVYAFGSQTLTLAQTWNIVLTGLPGILLQWALVPLLTYRLKGITKHDA